jgi:hypothetical protein
MPSVNVQIASGGCQQNLAPESARWRERVVLFGFAPTAFALQVSCTSETDIAASPPVELIAHDRLLAGDVIGLVLANPESKHLE